MQRETRTGSPPPRQHPRLRAAITNDGRAELAAALAEDEPMLSPLNLECAAREALRLFEEARQKDEDEDHDEDDDVTGELAA